MAEPKITRDTLTNWAHRNREDAARLRLQSELAARKADEADRRAEACEQALLDGEFVAEAAPIPA